MSTPNKMAAKLREKIANGDFMAMPCCFDALSAKMIEQAGLASHSCPVLLPLRHGLASLILASCHMLRW